MLNVDILSGYVICGAGALVGAGMMRMTQADEPGLQRALRSFSLGFLVIGVSLLQLGFAGEQPHDRVSLSMLLACEGTFVGTAFFGWGFAALSGTRPPPGATSAIVFMAALLPVAWLAGARTFSVTFAVLDTAVAVVLAATQHRLWTGALHLVERVLYASLVGYAMTWVVRLYHTVFWTDSVAAYQAHLPASLVPYYAVFYGVIPVINAALVLNVVNARLTAALHARAMTDELTGVLTRRALNEIAPAIIERERRVGRNVAVLMMDIDHFKSVNDRLGHAVGDAVLRRSAGLLQRHLRSDGLVTRYGGEEFAAVVPVADEHDARQVGERLRRLVEQNAELGSAQPLAVTISVGVSILGPMEMLEAALRRADHALYRAKHLGRNRVELLAHA